VRRNTATSLTDLTRRIVPQAQPAQLISFTIRHQLVPAISNASLRNLGAALDIRNYFACWLRQASQPDWPSTSEPSIIQTISEWYWYNNPLLTVDVFEAPTANTTRLCRQIVVKSMPQRSMIFSAGIETDWPLKLLLDQSTYVRPDRVEQCSSEWGSADLVGCIATSYWSALIHFHTVQFLEDILYKYVFFLLSWIGCRLSNKI
jgi:hypothetical protein